MRCFLAYVCLRSIKDAGGRRSKPHEHVDRVRAGRRDRVRRPPVRPADRPAAANRRQRWRLPEWAALTSVNNAAWFAYFVASRYFVALAPAACATVLFAVIAVMLARRRHLPVRATIMITTWAAVLTASYVAEGRGAVGTLLIAGFALQVLPAIRTAYRADQPTGISRPTWTLILCELACWLTYGIHTNDPRLIVLGCTGVSASALILNRTHRPATTRFARTTHQARHSASAASPTATTDTPAEAQPYSGKTELRSGTPTS